MIRTIKISALALSAVLILWACGGGGSTPKDVAQKFLEAVETGDSIGVKPLATDATMAQLALYWVKVSTPTKRKVTVGEEKVDGNNATVHYKLGEDAKDYELKLVKSGEAWKAETTKSELLHESGDANPLGDMMNKVGEMAAGDSTTATEEKHEEHK